MFSANTSQVSEDRLYVEDVFSTYLYTGNGSTQTITNGIDLAGKGGLVWMKDRVASSYGNHILVDTVQTPAGSYLKTNSTDAAASSGFITFNSNGFYLPGNSAVNISGNATASWTFRKAPKFFDVVTYTGNGTAGRTVAHSLGVAPGTIIVKRTDAGAGWRVYHRSQPNGYGDISSTDAFYTSSAERVFGNGSTVVAPTSTDFTIGDATSINGSGATYVAYLFAHDTSSDGIIQCGSYTGGTRPTINLGWEPQWVMIKGATQSGDTYANWGIWDNMRGMPVGGNDPLLVANRSAQEGTTYTELLDYLSPTSTGFIVDPTNAGTSINNAGSTQTYIYIAIRRGPMRTPTSGTSVYGTVLSSGTNTTGVNLQPGILSDLMISRSVDTGNTGAYDRLRGVAELITNTTSGEGARGPTWAAMNGVITGSDGNQTYNNPAVPGTNFARWFFRRAPSFFDEVCLPISSFSVNGNHNLGVAPEMIIGKRRDSTGNWFVYHTGLTGVNSQGKRNEQLLLNSDAAKTTAASDGYFVDGLTATSFETYWWPSSSGTAVLYLFASAPGVSKIGTYTGNGGSQTINCGFAAGARFVMIKRTDSTGDWYVWDSARGIVSGNDPHLSLNSTAAEVTTDDSVDTDSSGFVVNQLSATNINVSSATYIYLAVA